MITDYNSRIAEYPRRSEGSTRPMRSVLSVDPPGPKTAAVAKALHEDIEFLYNAKMRDMDIALQLGCALKTVQRWRYRAKKLPNG